MASVLSYVLVAVALLVLVPSCVADVDSSRYSASSEVKQMHMDSITLLKNDSGTYITDLIKRIIPLFIVGFLCMMILMTWSMCLTCCCKKRNKPSSKFLIFIQVAAVVVGIVIFSLSMVLVSINATQSQIIVNDFPDTINYVLSMPTFVRSAIANATAAANQMNADLVIIGNVNAVFKNQVSAATTQVTSAISSLSAVNSSLQNLDQLAAFQNVSIYNDRQKYDNYRQLAYLLVVLIPMICILAHLAITFWNARYGWETDNGSKCKSLKSCMSPLLSACLMSFIVLLFILSAVLLLVTTVSADFCYDPYNSIVSVAELDKGDTVTFYLTCDASIPNNLPPSVKDSVTAVASANVVISTTVINDVFGQLAGKPGCETSTSCFGAIGDFKNQFNNGYINAFNNISYFGSCAFVQARVNGLVNLVCTRIFPTFNKAYGFFVAVGALVFFAEVLHRLSYPSSQSSGDSGYTADDSVPKRPLFGKAEEGKEYVNLSAPPKYGATEKGESNA